MSERSDMAQAASSRSYEEITSNRARHTHRDSKWPRHERPPARGGLRALPRRMATIFSGIPCVPRIVYAISVEFRLIHISSTRNPRILGFPVHSRLIRIVYSIRTDALYRASVVLSEERQRSESKDCPLGLVGGASFRQSAGTDGQSADPRMTATKRPPLAGGLLLFQQTNAQVFETMLESAG